MKYLEKTWIRVLVSLVCGGFANEIVFLSTGDPTRAREGEGSGITIVVALVVYIIFTSLVNKDKPPRIDKLG